MFQAINDLALRQQNIQDYQDLAARALETNTLIPAITQSVPDCTVQEAYELLLRNAARREQSGDPRIGYKVGVLSSAAQKAMDVFEPVFGCLFRSMVYDSGAVLDLKTLNHPALEVEIALQVNHDIYKPIHTLDEALPCIKGIALAFELASGRLLTPPGHAADLIADYTAARGIVLGSRTNDMNLIRSLADEAVTLSCNERVVRTGDTTDVLGNPLKPFVWLANQLLVQGCFLKRGDLVMTGALVATTEIEAGDRFAAASEKLGSVEIQF